jgi:hypothetical protein
MDQVENRVSGTEDKVEELYQTVKITKNTNKIRMEHMRHLGQHEKTKSTNDGGRRRRGDRN